MTIYKNRLRSSFKVTWEAQDEISGSVKISNIDDSFSGRIATLPYRKNRLRSTFNTKLPKREIEETSIIKDTYVTDLTPTLNNGALEILKVGVDEEGFKYRTLIKMEVPEEMQNKHILKTELILTSNEQTGFDNLEVSLPNSDWQEYSVVWLGQPSRQKVLFSTDLEKNTYTHSIDLTDIVKEQWVFSKGENFGIILKAEDESKQQLINFSSRESYNPPKFKITYIDADLFTESGSVLSGRVRPTVRASNDLKGRVDVWRDNDVRGIDGKVKVHRDDTLEGLIDVASFKDIRGKLRVKEKFSEIQGRIYTFIDWLFGRVKTNAKNDIVGKIIANPNTTLNGRLNVMYHDSLEGKAIIRPLEYHDMNGKIYTNAKTDLNGKINVIYKDEITGKINIKQFYDMNGRVRPTVRLDNEINGILTTILKSQLVGKIKVNQIALPSKVIVRANDELKGTLQTRALNEIEGRVLSTIKTELDGHVRSRAKEIYDLNGKLTLGEIPEIEEDEIYIFIM